MSVEVVDPDCAICNRPASAKCGCESHRLDQAVRNAEQRMMNGMLTDIRVWVRERAQDYILEYYNHLKLRRIDAHQHNINQITQHANYYFRSAPNPNDILVADIEYKRGLNEDWKASVVRYPEVLEYFYSLVDLSLPSDEDRSVRDPPLSALHGVARRAGMVSSAVPEVIGKNSGRPRSRTRIAPRFGGIDGSHNAAYDIHGGVPGYRF